MLGKRYAPLSELTAAIGWMSEGPLRVTLTPGRTAPLPSVTLPKTSPVLTCAIAALAPANNRRHSHAPLLRTRLFIHPPGRLDSHPSRTCKAKHAQPKSVASQNQAKRCSNVIKTNAPYPTFWTKRSHAKA